MRRGNPASSKYLGEQEVQKAAALAAPQAPAMPCRQSNSEWKTFPRLSVRLVNTMCLPWHFTFIEIVSLSSSLPLVAKTGNLPISDSFFQKRLDTGSWLRLRPWFPASWIWHEVFSLSFGRVTDTPFNKALKCGSGIWEKLEITALGSAKHAHIYLYLYIYVCVCMHV